MDRRRRPIVWEAPSVTEGTALARAAVRHASTGQPPASCGEFGAQVSAWPRSESSTALNRAAPSPLSGRPRIGWRESLLMLSLRTMQPTTYRELKLLRRLDRAPVARSRRCTSSVSLTCCGMPSSRPTTIARCWATAAWCPGRQGRSHPLRHAADPDQGDHPLAAPAPARPHPA